MPGLPRNTYVGPIWCFALSNTGVEQKEPCALAISDVVFCLFHPFYHCDLVHILKTLCQTGDDNMMLSSKEKLESVRFNYCELVI